MVFLFIKKAWCKHGGKHGGEHFAEQNATTPLLGVHPTTHPTQLPVRCVALLCFAKMYLMLLCFLHSKKQRQCVHFGGAEHFPKENVQQSKMLQMYLMLLCFLHSKKQRQCKNVFLQSNATHQAMLSLENCW